MTSILCLFFKCCSFSEFCLLWNNVIQTPGDYFQMPHEAEELENLISLFGIHFSQHYPFTTDWPPGSQSPYCRTPLLSKVPVQASFMVSNIFQIPVQPHALSPFLHQDRYAWGLSKGPLCPCWDQLLDLAVESVSFHLESSSLGLCCPSVSGGWSGTFSVCREFVGKIKMNSKSTICLQWKTRCFWHIILDYLLDGALCLLLS